MTAADTAEAVETLRAEGLVSLTKAAKAYGMSAASLSRWCSRGGRTPAGERVRLEHARSPGKVLTSVAAVGRFLTAVTGTPMVAGVPSRSPADRQRAATEAARQLKAMGIG